jgi:hypothetical protein
LTKLAKINNFRIRKTQHGVHLNNHLSSRLQVKVKHLQWGYQITHIQKTYFLCNVNYMYAEYLDIISRLSLVYICRTLQNLLFRICDEIAQSSQCRPFTCTSTNKYQQSVFISIVSLKTFRPQLIGLSLCTFSCK